MAVLCEGTDFSRKDVMACIPLLVPRRSDKYSVCDAWSKC